MEKREILKKYRPSPDNILYILHELQDSNPRHYLTEEDLKLVAEYLRLPLSYVHGVATFYSMFSLKPRGRYIIRLCQSPPCWLQGAFNLKEKLEELLGIKMGETTPDGLFTLEFSSCLGVCGVAPAMMINDTVYGNLTPEKVEEIIEDLRG